MHGCMCLCLCVCVCAFVYLCLCVCVCVRHPPIDLLLCGTFLNPSFGSRTGVSLASGPLRSNCTSASVCRSTCSVHKYSWLLCERTEQSGFGCLPLFTVVYRCDGENVSTASLICTFKMYTNPQERHTHTHMHARTHTRTHTHTHTHTYTHMNACMLVRTHASYTLTHTLQHKLT